MRQNERMNVELNEKGPMRRKTEIGPLKGTSMKTINLMTGDS